MLARKLVTAPSASDPVVTLSELKAHLRVTSDAEDVLISSLRDAAVEHLEMLTERRFVTQTWDLFLDCFPTVIEVPYPPLASVSSISYVDSDGDTQTLSSSVYTVDANSEPGRVYLAYDQSWPTTRDIPHAVTVRFVCGYGAASAVPERIKAAAKLLIGHWYENREAAAMGPAVTEVPLSVRSLVAGVAIPEGL